MPYKVKKQNNKWVKVKADTGEIVSHHDTKEKALASIRAYYANKNKIKNEGHVETIYSPEFLKQYEVMEDEIFDEDKYPAGKAHQLAVERAKELRKNGWTCNVKKYDLQYGSYYYIQNIKRLKNRDALNKTIILKIYNKERPVKIKMEKYKDGASHCLLLSNDIDEVIADLSLDIEGKSNKLAKNEFFLNNDNENITNQLITKGVLIPTGKQVATSGTIVKSYKISNAYVSKLFEIDSKLNDYKITYIDKNGKTQEMISTQQQYKEKIDDLKKAGNKNIIASKITDVVKEQKVRSLLKKHIIKELKRIK